MDIGTWIEHRRGDGERIGWMRPEADGFVAVDLLGRDVTGVVEWLEAETVLEELGIGYLADPYLLEVPDGERMRVRLVEVSPAGIRVKEEDYGDVTAPPTPHLRLPWPMPQRLHPLG